MAQGLAALASSGGTQLFAARQAEFFKGIRRVTGHQLPQSGNVLFGAKYVSTIIRATASARSITASLDRIRILPIKACSLTSAEISELSCTSASAYNLDASSMNSLYNF